MRLEVGIYAPDCSRTSECRSLRFSDRLRIANESRVFGAACQRASAWNVKLSA
jgi:hypothetical protein